MTINLQDIQLDKIKNPKPLFRRLSLLESVSIPKPLHGLNPRTIKGKEWWDEERKKAIRKNNFCCHACGTYARLEGHEVYDILLKSGIAVYIETVSLCSKCHRTVHLGLTIKQVGLMKAEKLKDRRRRLKSKYIIEKGEPSWGKWKLIFEGKIYKPKFKNKIAWSKHYNK